MNFFRLRVVNTLLFFATGILIGFILKERFYGPAKAQYPQRYQSVYSAQPEAAAQPSPEVETTVVPEETETPEPPAEPAPAKPHKTAPKAEPKAEEDYSSPLVIEPSEPEAEPVRKKDAVLRGSQDQFFKRPADYAGRELEMELQLITAKRSTGGWRLNFVYAGPDKGMDYLYVDDSEILGDKPDLRIGYVYKVRFRCSRGDTAAGNVLLLLTPTGDKASWATGISAVE
jgi:hypothetical protein